MNFSHLTTKEVIIEITKEKPFLTVEEIAKEANTTPKYVRTIQSEAKLGLMKLRKDKYRQLKENYYCLLDAFIELENSK